MFELPFYWKVFSLATGRSILLPETTRKPLTAAGSQTAAITVEKLSKSPVSLSDTYEYTQVSGKTRRRRWNVLVMYCTSNADVTMWTVLFSKQVFSTLLAGTGA